MQESIFMTVMGTGQRMEFPELQSWPYNMVMSGEIYVCVSDL